MLQQLRVDGVCTVKMQNRTLLKGCERQPGSAGPAFVPAPIFGTRAWQKKGVRPVPAGLRADLAGGLQVDYAAALKVDNEAREGAAFLNSDVGP